MLFGGPHRGLNLSIELLNASSLLREGAGAGEERTEALLVGRRGALGGNILAKSTPTLPYR